MAERRNVLVPVISSIILLAGTAVADIDFRGVVTPNTREAWIDTAILSMGSVIDTFHIEGWGGDSTVEIDSFDFRDIIHWPFDIYLSALVDGVRARLLIQGPQVEVWYPFTEMTPPVPKVMFWVEEGLAGAPQNSLRRPRLDVVPSVLRTSVSISAEVPARQRALLEVLDAAGNRVRLLGVLEGTGPVAAVEWRGEGDDGSPLAEGIYFCRLQADAGVAVRKVLLAR